MCVFLWRQGIIFGGCPVYFLNTYSVLYIWSNQKYGLILTLDTDWVHFQLIGMDPQLSHLCREGKTLVVRPLKKNYFFMCVFSHRTHKRRNMNKEENCDIVSIVLSTIIYIYVHQYREFMPEISFYQRRYIAAYPTTLQYCIYIVNERVDKTGLKKMFYLFLHCRCKKVVEMRG